MSAVTNPNEQSQAIVFPFPKEQEEERGNGSFVILDGISWDTYERLSADLNNRGGYHLTYNGGVLEIMVMSSEHEESGEFFPSLMQILCEEFEFDLRSLGSTTFRKGNEKGFEADACFYIQSAPLIKGRKKITLENDPPPDVVVEVDITHGSLDKFPIYQSMNIKEVWRCEKNKWEVFHLIDGEYMKQENSMAVPQLTVEVVNNFFTTHFDMERPQWIRLVREWAHQQNLP
jgi:Uma2 family endonuclease